MNVIVVILLIVLAMWVFFAFIGGLINVLFTLLAGALIGWIASTIMGTRQRMGALANVVAGLVGALIGGIVSRVLIGQSYGVSFHPLALVFGVIGACIAIAIYKATIGGGRAITPR